MAVFDERPLPQPPPPLSLVVVQLHGQINLCSVGAPPGQQFALCDTGANANATPHVDILEDTFTLKVPFFVSSADACAQDMHATVAGWFQLHFSDHSTERILMYHCPRLTETVVSPEESCTGKHAPFTGWQITRLTPGIGTLNFILRNTRNLLSMPLKMLDRLTYIVRPRQIKSTQKRRALEAELWHMRLGHPGSYQFLHLPQ